MQAQLEEDLRAPAGDAAERIGRGAEAADVADPVEQIRQQAHRPVAVGLAAMPVAEVRDRLMRVGNVRNVDGLAVERRALAANRAEHLVVVGHVDTADLHHAVVLIADGNRIAVVAAHEALRAVDGIDDPAARRALRAAALLAQEFVLRERTQQGRAKRLLGLDVHFGHIVVVRLGANLNPPVVPERLAGLARSALRHGEPCVKIHHKSSLFSQNRLRPRPQICYNGTELEFSPRFSGSFYANSHLNYITNRSWVVLFS